MKEQSFADAIGYEMHTHTSGNNTRSADVVG
jgi:hypothetical protein